MQVETGMIVQLASIGFALAAGYGGLHMMARSTKAEVKELTATLRNGYMSRIVRMETVLDEVGRKLDHLGDLAEQVHDIQARCDAHLRWEDGMKDRRDSSREDRHDAD